MSIGKTLCMLSMLFLLANVYTLAQDFTPGNRIAIQVGATCAKAQDGSFRYKYVLFNEPRSEQRIWVFAVFTRINRDSISVDGSTNWDHGIPKNELLASVRWTPPDTLDLQPNATADGFEFVARGLPGILDVYAEGYHPPPSFPDGMATDSIPGYSDLTPYGPGIVGRTIGPVSNPNPFALLNFLDTLMSYTTESQLLGWIKNQASLSKYLSYFSAARTKLVQRDSIGANTVLLGVLRDIDTDSTTDLSSEGCALLRFNTEYLGSRLPQPQVAPFLAVKLVSSSGTNLNGGSLQYYDGSWKDATNNNDCTFSITTGLKTLSLRMTYEGSSQTKSNVTVGPDVVIFQTVSAQVKLQSSQGALMDTGSVQYYAGAWRSFGTTTSGIAYKELLPGNYSFRMTYVGGSNDKQQDIGANAVVVFQTVNASVQLKNSQGTPIDQGTVQYYAGAWRNFGTTTNGVVNKELLPNNYSFRMTYAFGNKDLQQNIGTNPVVVFQTANATVQLKNSQGASVDQGTVQYYAGAWRTFGTTSGGTVSNELLPISYSFRMTNEGVSNDKTQDISANSTVSFSTVLCTVSVKNGQGQPVDNAIVSYYATTWRQIGPTVNGQITKELLPANLTFRMSLGTASQDKVQNIAISNLVEFVTQ